MRLIVQVVLIALLAVAVQNAHAQDCSDGECVSTVSVYQDFATADCSGNYTLSVGSNYTKACVTDDYDSYNVTTVRTCSSSRFTALSTFDVNTCSRVPSTTTDFETIGVCKRTGTSYSRISWCNQASISNKFKAVKAPTNETRAPLLSELCNVTTGCTNNTGTLRTYPDATCTLSNTSEAYPASALFGNTAMLLKTCYTISPPHKRAMNGGRIGAFARNDLDESVTLLNVMATCANGQYTVVYSTGGCGASANILYGASFPTDTCVRFGDATWLKYSCPSAASTLVAGPLAFALLLIAFLFI